MVTALITRCGGVAFVTMRRIVRNVGDLRGVVCGRGGVVWGVMEGSGSVIGRVGCVRKKVLCGL